MKRYSGGNAYWLCRARIRANRVGGSITPFTAILAVSSVAEMREAYGRLRDGNDDGFSMRDERMRRIRDRVNELEGAGNAR